MIVLDAAALVDVVIDQPTKPWVLDHVSGEVVIAPSHQPAEVLSAITRLRRAGDLTARQARAALEEAMSLPQELVVPEPQHVARAFELHDRIRVLDGLYVALAEARRVPLLTTDQRLVRANPPCEVIHPEP